MAYNSRGIRVYHGGRYGSKQYMWLLEQEAAGSYYQSLARSRVQTESGVRLYILKSCLWWHPSLIRLHLTTTSPKQCYHLEDNPSNIWAWGSGGVFLIQTTPNPLLKYVHSHSLANDYRYWFKGSSCSLLLLLYSNKLYFVPHKIAEILANRPWSKGLSENCIFARCS